MAQRTHTPTIRDVARLTGVSANTVSRVLNGKTGVGTETRARILQVMEEMDYHPHIGARSLRGKSEAGCIGVTLPAPLTVAPVSQRFLVWLFAELYRVFGVRGERICFDMNPHASPLSADYGRGVWENLYRACLVAGPLATNDEIIHRIHERGVPYLALSRLDGFPELSCATVDYEKGAYLSVKHLIGLGHRKIAMLQAFPGYHPSVERMRGYIQALEEAGLPFDDRLVRPVTFDAQQLTSAVHRLLVDEEVTALVDCSGAEDGSSLREGARRAGRTAGQNFDIICWTYEDGRTVLREACAHLWVPVQEAASEGLDHLAEWYFDANHGPIRVVYPPIFMQDNPGPEVSAPNRLFWLP